MAKEGDTPKKKEQQQHVAARDASTQASTTAAKHKQDTESNESNNKKSTDREAKRAKVKAQAAQAQSIDVDADATPGPQLPNVNFAAPHQGPHGPHGPNTQMLITPGSNVSQPQTGPNVFQCYLQSYYTYIPGDVDPTDPSFEVMVSVREGEEGVWAGHVTFAIQTAYDPAPLAFSRLLLTRPSPSRPPKLEPAWTRCITSSLASPS